MANDLFAFLTTDPNRKVGAIYLKAMPVILTMPEAIEQWMTASIEEALKLQRPLPDDVLVWAAARSWTRHPPRRDDAIGDSGERSVVAVVSYGARIAGRIPPIRHACHPEPRALLRSPGNMHDDGPCAELDASSADWREVCLEAIALSEAGYVLKSSKDASVSAPLTQREPSR